MRKTFGELHIPLYSSSCLRSSADSVACRNRISRLLSASPTMPPPHSKAKCSVQIPQDSAPQRPRTLLQRVSSSFISILPRIPSRRGSSSANRDDRPGTAPGHDHIPTLESMRSRMRLHNTQQTPVPHVEIPKLSHSERNCPYEPNLYHSFPSIEQKGGDLCGLRPLKPRHSTSDRPCSHCRTKSPLFHIVSSFKRSHSQDRSITAVESSLAPPIKSSNSSEEPPRAVSAVLVAKRVGNPPRKSSLPRDLRPSYKTLRPSSAQSPDSSTHQSIVQRALSQISYTSKTHEPRPISPKLHHLHGLPHAKDHPYMHKRELEAHLAALRAGSPSPLRRSIDELTPSPVDDEPYQDFSRTVFYGTTISSAARVSRRTPSPAHTVMHRVETSRSVIIGQRRRPMYAEELECSGVYRQPSAQGHRHRASPAVPQAEYQDADDESAQTRSTIGGNSVRWKGGNEKPRLRGGSGKLQMKEWILGCPPAYLSKSSDSATDIPATPRPAPEHAVHRNRARACLPALEKPLVEPRQSRAAPLVPYHSSSTHQIAPPVPTLRGGAASAVRLPPTLYWLAGGTGAPVTIDAWQKRKGRRRMGGMLGLAIYGAQAGTLYTDSQDSQSSLSPSSASMKTSTEPSRARPVVVTQGQVAGENTSRADDSIATAQEERGAAEGAGAGISAPPARDSVAVEEATS
ncbi:hypothetical protein BDU57DRAFT_510281 [Ampelomyces quisqualis]|uniref:Uncharacterized protein n=1 Tax=Ampelomyces quisqualis TaxID=50730 RepID=A0A6A5R093_AMPQU|nr:hypothetical protein BDU57DRAFT_510281 [Ampelomyces quisqualis]